MTVERDEPIERAKPRRGDGQFSDRILIGTGVGLAAAAALFPWYVFLNPDKFGIRTSTSEQVRDYTGAIAHNSFSVSPLALPNKNPTPEVDSSPFDQPDKLTTAAVPSVAKDEGKGRDGADQQPFPGKNTFKLMHVANGRAMIEDATGIYMVRVGSILPDNSRLATIEQRNGRWVVITTKGEAYAEESQVRP